MRPHADRPDVIWDAKRKYAWLEQLTRDRRLSCLAVRLGFLLGLCYVNAKQGFAWPSQPLLADELGTTLNSIRRTTHQLVSCGHLKVHAAQGRGVSTRYYPIWVEASPVATAGDEGLATALQDENALQAQPQTQPPRDGNPTAGPQNPNHPEGQVVLESSEESLENSARERCMTSRFERVFDAWVVAKMPGSSRKAASARWGDAANRYGEEALERKAMDYVRQVKDHPVRAKPLVFWLQDGGYDDKVGRNKPLRALLEPFPDAEIRTKCIAIFGESWVQSYIDGSSWNPETRTLTARTQTAFLRIRDKYAQYRSNNGDPNTGFFFSAPKQ